MASFEDFNELQWKQCNNAEYFMYKDTFKIFYIMILTFIFADLIEVYSYIRQKVNFAHGLIFFIGVIES